MGANKTPPVGKDGKLQGIVLQDPRIQHGAIQGARVAAPYGSSFTQQGVKAGVPEPQQRSSLILKASETQTAGTSYTVETRTAGHPLPSDGGFVWHDDASEDTFGPDGYERSLPYGHDGYQVITGWDGERRFPNPLDLNVEDMYTRPDLIRLHFGDLLGAYYEKSLASGDGTLVVVRYDPSTGVWESTWTSLDGANADDRPVSLVALPSGRVVMFWVDANANQVNATSSDDSGATWTNYANSVLNDSAEPISGMAVSYSAGVVLMLTSSQVGAAEPRMEQWISYDLGCTFDQVGTEFSASTGGYGTGGQQGYSPTVEGLDNGIFLVGYADRGSGLAAGKAKYRCGPVDPAQPIYNQLGEYVANAATSTDLVIQEEACIWTWRDEDRTCYLLANFGGQGYSHTTMTAIFRSEDSGHSWLTYATQGCIYMDKVHAMKYAANSVGGRAVVLSFFDYDTYYSGEDGEGAETHGFADEERISVLYLGGHARQTVCATHGTDVFNPTSYIGWSPESDTTSSALKGRCYLPVVLPDDSGWVELTSGSSSSALTVNVGELTLTSATGVVSYNIAEAAGYGDERVNTVAVRVQCVSGGSRTTTECGLILRVTDCETTPGTVNASFNHAVKLCINTTGFRLLDEDDGSTVVDVDFDMTDPTWIYIALAGGNVATGEVALFYGRDHEEHDTAGGLGTQRRALTPAVATDGIIDQTGGGGGSLTQRSRLDWGHVNTGVAVSRWSFVGSSVAGREFAPRQGLEYVANWIGGTTTDPQVRVSALNSREWPTVPALLIDGVRISAGDGPGKEGDKWTIEPRYDFGIENIDTTSNASPRVPWRSREETPGGSLTEQTIVWRLEDKHAAWSLDFGNFAFGVVLLNCNFKSAFLERYYSGAWHTLAELDASIDLDPLTYTRNGSIIRPNPSSAATAPKWLHRNELVGATLDMGSGSALARYKHIRGNTEGSWYSDGSGTLPTRSARIMYETSELSAGDPISSAAGSAAVWRRNMGAVVYNFNPAVTIAEPVLRLRIPAQANADGYFQIGSVIIGEVAVFGHQFDRGLSWQTMPNVQDISRPDGSRRPHNLGPIRRAVQLAWAETAIDATRTQGGLSDDSETLAGTANNPDYVALTASGLPVASKHDTVSLMEGIVRQTGGSTQPIVFMPRLPVQSGSSMEVVQFADDKLFLYGRIDGGHQYEVVQGNEGVDEVQRLNTITITEEV
jgi:hypothetical protein